jgi:hypothetical protein
MAKAIKPEDCLRGHQIVPTEKLKSMLARAGFESRMSGTGTSHVRYWHPQFPEISPFGIVVNTGKRDSQFHAAKAVLKAQDLKNRKNNHQPREPLDVWLRALGKKLDQDDESFEVEESGVVVSSLQWPAIGVSLPLYADGAVMDEKISRFRGLLNGFDSAIERYARIYGVCRGEDTGDGAVHLYQPDWRLAISFARFNGRDGAQNPIADLGGWEAELRRHHKSQQQSDALDEFADDLRKRYPDEIILRDGRHVVMRDAGTPYIGTAFTAADKYADVQARWRDMKNAAIAFEERLRRLETEFEFRQRRGRRSLYLNHAIYEKLEGRIPLFSKNADNELAFETLDALEKQTLYRDRYLQIARSDFEKLYRLSLNRSEQEDDGLIRRKYTLAQLGVASTTVEISTTPAGRISWGDDAYLHEILVDMYFAAAPRVVASLGYDVTQREDGTLDLKHNFYDSISFSVPRYRQVLAQSKVTAFAERFLTGEGRVTDLEDYDRVKSDAGPGIGLLWKALDRLCETRDPIMREFNRLDADICRDGAYAVNVRRISAQKFELIYTKRNPMFPGPDEARIPAYRLPEVMEKNIYITNASGLEKLRALHRDIKQEKFTAGLDFDTSTLSSLFRRPAPLGSLAAQQNIKRAAAALSLPGLGGPKYNKI